MLVKCHYQSFCLIDQNQGDQEGGIGKVQLKENVLTASF